MEDGFAAVLVRIDAMETKINSTIQLGTDRAQEADKQIQAALKNGRYRPSAEPPATQYHSLTNGTVCAAMPSRRQALLLFVCSLVAPFAVTTIGNRFPNSTWGGYIINLLMAPWVYLAIFVMPNGLSIPVWKFWDNKSPASTTS